MPEPGTHEGGINPATSPSVVYETGWDDGQEAIWTEPVCSACGRNHDRDESAMCDEGEVVSFADWVEAKRA